MSFNATATFERSESHVANLIQQRPENEVESLTAAELIGRLVVPPLVRNPRDSATRVVVIAGGAASGKSTLAEAMSEELNVQDIPSAIISSDDYVRWDRAERQRREAAGMHPEGKYNFGYMREVISSICANQTSGRTIEAPQYDSHSGLAIDGKLRRHIPKVGVLFVEGDMLGERGKMPQALYPGSAIEPMTLLYLHVSDEERRNRRIARDMEFRNANDETAAVIAESFDRRQDAQHFPYTLTYASAADSILRPTMDDVGGGIQTYNLHDMSQLALSV